MQIVPKSMLMKINTLIDRDYPTASILEDTRDVWNYLLGYDYIAIMDEDFAIPGIVTIKDLRNQPDCRNLIDCNIEKPKVFLDSNIFEVFQVMTDGNFECLPVYEGDDFQGVITLAELAKTFAEMQTDSKQEYQAVIHDLRNPLSNLYNLIKIIQEPATENIELIAMCEASCDHALHILDELVYLAADDNRSLAKEETELNTFYKSCIEGQKGLSARKNVSIETAFTDVPYYRKIDRLKIQRSVENLLSNAIKFSYPNSAIKISTKRTGDLLTLKILDAGIGIPSAIQADIFERFTIARRAGTNGEASVGLGLSFTKQCIEQHGGQLYFKSTEGKGTKFYVVL